MWSISQGERRGAENEGGVIDGNAAGFLSRVGQIPGSTYGILGLAFALCSLEVHRYPVVHLVSGEFSTINMVIAIVTLALVAFLNFRGKGNAIARPSVLLAASVFGSLCLYVSFSSDSQGLFPVGFAGLPLHIFTAVGILILSSWMAVLYRKDRTDAAIIFIGAIGVSGCLQAAVAMLSQGVVQGTCALFPALSCLFFYLFTKSERGLYGLVSTQHATDEGLAGGGMRLRSTSYALLFVLAGCYGFFFARMHAMWLPVQDAWGAIPIQIASASGALLASFALALVGALPNRRMSVLLCECLMLAFAFFSIYLSSLNVSGFETLYLCPFNAAQKTVIYLCFFGCLACPDVSRRMIGFCVLFGAFRSSNIIFRTVDAATSATMGSVVIDSLYVAAMVVATILLVVIMAHPHNLPNMVPNKPRGAAPKPSGPTAAPTDEMTEQYRSIAFYFLFGQKYTLTQREIELLPLLVRDTTVKEISDTLSISQATVKTHVRNIYQKLAVHNHDDLVHLVEADKVQLFEHLPEWYMIK